MQRAQLLSMHDCDLGVPGGLMRPLCVYLYKCI